MLYIVSFRLEAALQQKKATKFKIDIAAKNEVKLLEFHKVGLPTSNTTSYEPSDIDGVSVDILLKYHPAYLEENVPLKTIGDGNCLYRAISKHMTGSEMYHKLIRLETALELIVFRDKYDHNSKTKHDFLSDSRIVTSSSSKLIEDAVKLGSYSELAHIYATSAFVRQPIRSYYPPQLHPELTSEVFTRTVVGRDVKLSNTVICIMWTSACVPSTANSFTPNHFVPIVRKPNGASPICVNIDNSINYDVTNIVDVTDTDVTDADVDNTDTTNIDVTDDGTGSMTEVVKDDVTDISVGVTDTVMTVEETEMTVDVNADADIIQNDDDDDDDDDVDDIDDDDNPAKGKLTPNCFMETSKAVNLLLNTETCYEHIPGGKKENVFFVLNNESNQAKREGKGKSSFSDDCGVWESGSGTTPATYYLLQENGDLRKTYYYKKLYCRQSRHKVDGKLKVVYTPLDPQPPPEKVVVIHRYYAKSSKDRKYEKRVTWFGKGGLQSKYAVAEYIGQFPGLGPHGNSRDPASEYLRTPSFVIEEASELLKQNKPKMVYEELKQKYDEVTRPANVQQLRDKKKYEKGKEKPVHFRETNVADNIQHLDNLVTQNHSYVRAVIRTNNKTPGVILYSDEQIEDIKNLCSTGKSVLSVDKTFNLCQMHVTVTCFKQLSVVKSDSKEAPIFIGPIFLHDNSDFDTYCHFFHHLKVKLVDTNLKKLVIGSDDERAMVKAITTAFPEATHILCTRHLRQNANQKLVDDAIDKREKDKIMGMLFGEEGIINADDTVCFEQKSAEFDAYCSNSTVSFQTYFQKRLKEQLRTKVNEPVRHNIVSAGWTNNNCESINHVLKQAVDWKSKSLLELVSILEKRVSGQYSELRGALLGTGEFRLADTHQQFELTKTEWVSKTKAQRLRLYKRFRNFVPTDGRILTSTDGRTEIIAPRTLGRKPGQRKRGINERTRTNKRKKDSDN